MSTIDLCEKYFGKRDIYEVLEIAKDAEAAAIKKAYHKLSLLVHPDRVSEEEKTEATEKFKVLSKIYQILSDTDKRALYDERGIVDDDDDERMDSKLVNWLDLWRKLFQPLTLDAITKYEQSYINSDLERADIKKSYLSTKGNIDKMIDEVPFLKVADEPRLHTIVREMIDAEEVPDFKMFTKEDAGKRKRRHQKYARESKIADKIKEKHLQRAKEREEAAEGAEPDGDLAKALLERSKARETNFDSLLDKLAEKYGGDDGTETKKRKKQPVRGVKNGRVEKRKK